MATSPVSPAGAAGSTPRSAVWELLLQGRPNLKPTDVQQVCDRFRRLRGDDDVTLTDSLTAPELAEVLGIDGGAAAVYPLFNLLRTDASSEGTHCDLRVLLVAMAGLTRKKAVDRMKFAALLLDEQETGYLTEEQMALVLHANSLLDTARAESALPTPHSALVAKARELMSGASAEGSPHLSHESFFELVRTRPLELGIAPDKKRARGAASSVASACTSAFTSPRTPLSPEADPAASSAASTSSPSKLQMAAAASAARLRPAASSQSSAGEASPSTSSTASPSKLQQAAAAAAARLLPPNGSIESTIDDASLSRSASPAPSKLQQAAAAAAARLLPPSTSVESKTGAASSSRSTSPAPSKLQQAAAAAAARLLPPDTSMASTAGNMSPSRSTSPAPSRLQQAAAAAAARLLPPTNSWESTTGDARDTSPAPNKLQQAAAAAAARLLPPETSMASAASASVSFIAPLPSVDSEAKAVCESSTEASSVADKKTPSVTTAWGAVVEMKPASPLPATASVTLPEATAAEASAVAVEASAARPDAAESVAKHATELEAAPATAPAGPRVLEESALPLEAAVTDSSASPAREVEASSATASARSASQPRTSARSSSQPRTAAGTPPRSASRLRTTPEGRSRSTSRPRTPQEMSELAALVSSRAAEKATAISPATAAHPDLRVAPLALPGGNFVATPPATPPLTPKALHSATATLPAPSPLAEPSQSMNPIPAWRDGGLNEGAASRSGTPLPTTSRGTTPRTARSGTPRSASRRGTPRTGSLRVAAAADFRRLPLAPGGAHGLEAEQPSPPPASSLHLPGPPSHPVSARSATGPPSTAEGVTPIPARRVLTGWATPEASMSMEHTTAAKESSPAAAAAPTFEAAGPSADLARRRARPGTPQVLQDFGTPTPRADAATPRVDDGPARVHSVSSAPQGESESTAESAAAAAQPLRIPAAPAPLLGAMRTAGGLRQSPPTGHSDPVEQTEGGNNFALPPLPQCRPLALPPALPSLAPPPAAPLGPPQRPPGFGAPPPPPPLGFATPPPPPAAAADSDKQCLTHGREAAADAESVAQTSQKARCSLNDVELPGTPRHDFSAADNLATGEEVRPADALQSAAAQQKRTPSESPGADSSIKRPSDFPLLDSSTSLKLLDSSTSLQLSNSQPSTRKPAEPPELTQEPLARAQQSRQDSIATATTALSDQPSSLGPTVTSSSRPPTPRTPPPTSPRTQLRPPPLPTDPLSCVENRSQVAGAESDLPQPTKPPIPATRSPRMPLLHREPWSEIKRSPEDFDSKAGTETLQKAPSLEEPVVMAKAMSQELPGAGTEAELPGTPRHASVAVPDLTTDAVIDVKRSIAVVAHSQQPAAEVLLSSAPDLPMPPTPPNSSAYRSASQPCMQVEHSSKDLKSAAALKSPAMGQEPGSSSRPPTPRNPPPASLQKPPTPPLFPSELRADYENSSEDLRGAAASGSRAPPPLVGQLPPSSSGSPFPQDTGTATEGATEDLRAAAMGSMASPLAQPPPPSSSKPPTPRSPPPALLHRTPIPPLPLESQASPRMPLLLREPWADAECPAEDLRAAASECSQSRSVQPRAVQSTETSAMQLAEAEAGLPGTPRHASSAESEAAVHKPAVSAETPSGLEQTSFHPAGRTAHVSSSEDARSSAPHQQVAPRSGRSERSGQRLFTPGSARSAGSSRSVPKALKVPDAPTKTSLSARLANYMRGPAPVLPAEELEVQSVSSGQPSPPPSPHLPPAPILQPAPLAAVAQTEMLDELQEASVSPQDPQEVSPEDLQEVSVSPPASSAASPGAQQSEGRQVQRGKQRITGPGCPPRPQKRPAHVPPLDFSSVIRIIDGEPAAPEAQLLPAPDLESPGGSSLGSGAAGAHMSPGTPRVTAEAAENEQNEEGLEFYFIGSEAGSSSPSSKAASVTSWNQGAAAAEENAGGHATGKKEQEDLELGMQQPDWADWTYGRYVMEQQRRTLLKWVSCQPMRAGQRRLLVIALVLLQIALLLFVLDAGGIGGATASAVGYQIREAQIALAIFAALAAVVTLCFCAGLWDNLASDAREVGLGGLTLSEEASETTPALRAGRGIAVRAAGHESRYKELLRRMKEQNKPASSEEPSQDLLQPAQESLGTDVPVPAEEVVSFQTRSLSPEKEQPRSWPGPDRRRYLQLKGGDEEAMTASGPALRAVGARGLRMPSRRLATGGGSSRALRSAPRAVAAAGAEELEGWS